MRYLTSTYALTDRLKRTSQYVWEYMRTTYPELGSSAFRDNFFHDSQIQYVFIPVWNCNGFGGVGHFGLIVICPRNHTVEYYDSASARGVLARSVQHIDTVLDWLKFELGELFDIMQWSYYNPGAAVILQQNAPTADLPWGAGGSIAYACASAFNVAFGFGNGPGLYNRAPLIKKRKRIASELIMANLSPSLPSQPHQDCQKIQSI
jgi:hypothetical protein